VDQARVLRRDHAGIDQLLEFTGLVQNPRPAGGASPVVQRVPARDLLVQGRARG
jgi:hypothetical protein